ncbi:MAG TPA: hypothetical protein VFZ96_00230 [Actinomycetota bacterium]|nr:hypothetical protein [Actinomycetota bacterium]
MQELRDRVLGLLRATEGSMTEGEICERTGASAVLVRGALEHLARTGGVFRIRYKGDPVGHWRASAPSAFGHPDERARGTVRDAVRSVLRGNDWGLTEQQISEATGVGPRAIRSLLERLFRDNSVIKVRYRDDPDVYWRAAGIRARPSP